jgi:hypothetical protein
MTVLAAIVSFCEALKAIFVFLATAEGQTFCQEYRDNRDKVHAVIAAWWADAKGNLEKWPALWKAQPDDIKNWWGRIFT